MKGDKSARSLRRSLSWSSLFGAKHGSISNPPKTSAIEPPATEGMSAEDPTEGAAYWGLLAAQNQHSPEMHHGGDYLECLKSSSGRKEESRWDWINLKSWNRPEEWEMEGDLDATNTYEPFHLHGRDILHRHRSISLNHAPWSATSSARTARPRSMSSNNSTPTPTPTRTFVPHQPPTPNHILHRSPSMTSILSSQSSTPSSPRSRTRSLSLRFNTTLDDQGRRVLHSRRGSISREQSPGPLPVHRVKKRFGVGSDSDEEEGCGDREETLTSDDSQSLSSPTSELCCPSFSSHASSTSLSSFSRTSSLSRTISSNSSSSVCHSLSRKITPPTVLRRRSEAPVRLPVLELGGIRRSTSQNGAFESKGRLAMPTRWEPDDGYDYSRPLLRIANPDPIPETSASELRPALLSSPPSVLLRAKSVATPKNVFIGWAL